MAAPRHPSHRATRIRGSRPAEPARAPLPPAEPVADPARPRSVIDYGLTRLKRSGVYDELYLRWFPVSFY